MDFSTVAMWGMVACLVLLALRRGEGVAWVGLKAGGGLFLSVLPRMLAAFAVAGLIQALIPQDVILRWIGKDSGLQGLLIGSMAGAMTPGGPMLSFPILASLYQQGAGAGPLVAYLSAWSLLGVHRLIIWEIPMLGPRFAFTRIAVTLVIPPVLGWAMGLLARHA
jgi:uncharacterized membrane protein YraQ (UPF0718 family)